MRSCACTYVHAQVSPTTGRIAALKASSLPWVGGRRGLAANAGWRPRYERETPAEEDYYNDDADIEGDDDEDDYDDDGVRAVGLRQSVSLPALPALVASQSRTKFGRF